MVKQRKGVKEDFIVPMKNVEPKSNVPTLEQLRIAQILEKKVVDSAIELKIKQIMDATERTADEVYVALHDSDFDENRAVDLLIEGEDQLAHWCISDRRKKKLAELKEKKDAIQPEGLQEKKDTRGRGDKSRLGRKQVSGRLHKPPDVQRKPLPSTETKATKGKHQGSSGFGSMVFERSRPPPIDPGFLPPVKNQWEKPLLRAASRPEDDWDCEEFQGSLSQTQIFTSSKRIEQQGTTDKARPTMTQSPPAALSSLTFTNKAHDQPELDRSVILQNRDPAMDSKPNIQETPNLVPPRANPVRTSVANMPEKKNTISQGRTTICTQDTPRLPVSAENPTEFVHRLNYNRAHEEKRPHSKIPTLPVEMPPETNPSVSSFLDIQFGAMDICPSDTNCGSQSNHSDTPHNPSITSLIQASRFPSSCSNENLTANSSTYSSSTEVNSSITSSSSRTDLTCSNPSGISSTANPTGSNGVSSPKGMHFSRCPPGMQSIKTAATSSINSLMTTGVNQSWDSIANSSLNGVVNSSNSITNMASSSIQKTSANLSQSNMANPMNHVYGASNNQRFLTSSQNFNTSSMQYGVINQPVPSHGFEPRANPPPPHHLPPSPFKSPPGIPKSAMAPNLPPGSLMSNQYMVGQGNVPYFPHPPIYYYEEVPPVMNSQQRLASMTSHPHPYDVTYQAAPSSRDSVHYNV